MIAALSRQEHDALLESLASPNEEVRRLAVEQLLLLPADEAVRELVRCLGDPAWRVRKTAIERLVVCRDEALVHPGLLAALADGENPGRRNAAFETLVALGGIGGDAAVGALLRIATEAEEAPLVRLSALRSLDRLESSVGVDVLAGAVAHPQLRPAALELLGHSTDPEATATLEKGLASGARSIRESAIGGLLRQLARRDGAEADAFCARLAELAASDASLVERCCDGLDGEDLARRVAVVQFLGLVADQRAILPMLQAGRDEALGPLVDATLATLGAVTVDALRRVWGVLGSDLELRACSVLGRIGGDGGAELLAATLLAPRPEASTRAAIALGEGGFVRRLPDLVRRLAAAAAEGDADRADEIDALIDAIVALAERTRSLAGDAPGALVEILASGIAGAPEPVRLALAPVLARIGGPADAAVVERLSKDASPLVRRAAVQALERLDPERGRPMMRLALGDESSGVRIAAAGVLGRSDARSALDDLARLAVDGDPRVAAAALRAAGGVFERVGDTDPADRAWLVGALEREAQVALAALESLERVGGADGVAAAQVALGRPEPEVVRAAIACLARHAGPDALGPLVELVGHSDWSIRAEAVQVLAARRVRRALPAVLRRLDVEEDAFVRDAMLAAARRLEE